MPLIKYFAALSRGKVVLWCYLIWYLVTVFLRFDPSPRLWLNSLGISAVIGTGLLLSVSNPAGVRADRWQTFRLFMMPFCVSSFSALIKGHDYVLIFPSDMKELAFSIVACAGFVLSVGVAQKSMSAKSERPDSTN